MPYFIPSCFDANAGLFETLLGPEDAILSDHLNHASIIDGIRLCKAKRFRYPNGDLQALEKTLQESAPSKRKLIVTDGVFSMDGLLAPLQGIVELAKGYDALLMVDDSHATGFMGEQGRGSLEHCGVLGQVDIITSTLGKALGGGSGGFTVAKKEIIDLLRQYSRPYLFSNTLPPALIAGSMEALRLVASGQDLRKKLQANTDYFRSEIQALGFKVKAGSHPIVPIMLYDANIAQQMASRLLELGIYVIGFFYPVVS